MERFDKLLSLLWGTRIESYNIDLINHTIHLVIKRIEMDDTESIFEMKLEDVVSFCWINSFEELRLQLYEWDYLDLTSVDYETNAKIRFLGSDFLSQFSASPNICLEIWSSLLLVEAKRVSINEEVFGLIKD